MYYYDAPGKGPHQGGAASTEGVHPEHGAAVQQHIDHIVAWHKNAREMARGHVHQTRSGAVRHDVNLAVAQAVKNGATKEDALKAGMEAMRDAHRTTGDPEPSREKQAEYAADAYDSLSRVANTKAKQDEHMAKIKTRKSDQDLLDLVKSASPGAAVQVGSIRYQPDPGYTVKPERSVPSLAAPPQPRDLKTGVSGAVVLPRVGSEGRLVPPNSAFLKQR